MATTLPTTSTTELTTLTTSELLNLLQSKVDYYYNSLPEAREAAAEQFKEVAMLLKGMGIEDAQEHLKPLALLMDLLKAIEKPQDD